MFTFLYLIIYNIDNKQPTRYIRFSFINPLSNTKVDILLGIKK